MTCFSIHKKFRLLLILLLIGATTGGYYAPAHAGNDEAAQESEDANAPDDEDAAIEDDKQVKGSSAPKPNSAAALKELQRVDAPIHVLQDRLSGLHQAHQSVIVPPATAM